MRLIGSAGRFGGVVATRLCYARWLMLGTLADARHGQVQFVSPVNRSKVLSYAWDYGEGSFQNRVRSLALKLLAAEASGEFLVPEELLPAVDDVA